MTINQAHCNLAGCHGNTVPARMDHSLNSEQRVCCASWCVTGRGFNTCLLPEFLKLDRPDLNSLILNCRLTFLRHIQAS